MKNSCNENKLYKIFVDLILRKITYDQAVQLYKDMGFDFDQSDRHYLSYYSITEQQEKEYEERKKQELESASLNIEDEIKEEVNEEDEDIDYREIPTLTDEDFEIIDEEVDSIEEYYEGSDGDSLMPNQIEDADENDMSYDLSSIIFDDEDEDEEYDLSSLIVNEENNNNTHSIEQTKINKTNDERGTINISFGDIKDFKGDAIVVWNDINNKKSDVNVIRPTQENGYDEEDEIIIVENKDYGANYVIQVTPPKFEDIANFNRQISYLYDDIFEEAQKENIKSIAIPMMWVSGYENRQEEIISISMYYADFAAMDSMEITFYVNQNDEEYIIDYYEGLSYTSHIRKELKKLYVENYDLYIKIITPFINQGFTDIESIEYTINENTLNLFNHLITHCDVDYSEFKYLIEEDLYLPEELMYEVIRTNYDWEHYNNILMCRLNIDELIQENENNKVKYNTNIKSLMGCLFDEKHIEIFNDIYGVKNSLTFRAAGEKYNMTFQNCKVIVDNMIERLNSKLIKEIIIGDFIYSDSYLSKYRYNIPTSVPIEFLKLNHLNYKVFKKELGINTIKELQAKFPTYSSLLKVERISLKSIKDIVDNLDRLEINNVWGLYDEEKLLKINNNLNNSDQIIKNKLNKLKKDYCLTKEELLNYIEQLD